MLCGIPRRRRRRRRRMKKKMMMMMMMTTVTTMVMMESKSAENIQNDAGTRLVDLPLNCASGAQCFVSRNFGH
jgi:hypothetical protein